MTLLEHLSKYNTGNSGDSMVFDNKLAIDELLEHGLVQYGYKDNFDIPVLKLTYHGKQLLEQNPDTPNAGDKCAVCGDGDNGVYASWMYNDTPLCNDCWHDAKDGKPGHTINPDYPPMRNGYQLMIGKEGVTVSCDGCPGIIVDDQQKYWINGTGDVRCPGCMVALEEDGKNNSWHTCNCGKWVEARYTGNCECPVGSGWDMVAAQDKADNAPYPAGESKRRKAGDKGEKSDKPDRSNLKLSVEEADAALFRNFSKVMKSVLAIAYTQGKVGKAGYNVPAMTTLESDGYIEATTKIGKYYKLTESGVKICEHMNEHDEQFAGMVATHSEPKPTPTKKKKSASKKKKEIVRELVTEIEGIAKALAANHFNSTYDELSDPDKTLCQQIAWNWKKHGVNSGSVVDQVYVYYSGREWAKDATLWAYVNNGRIQMALSGMAKQKTETKAKSHSFHYEPEGE
jgi:DNA-binding PadR family transcriptional regulator